jgi:uncharacterized membrane protein
MHDQLETNQEQSKAFPVFANWPWHAAVYIVGLPAILQAHRAVPSGLGGPGLDVLAFIIWVSFIALFLYRGCFNKRIARDKRDASLFIHFVGIAVALFLMIKSF